MTCYAVGVCAIPEGTFAIRGYAPKSGITDDGYGFAGVGLRVGPG